MLPAKLTRVNISAKTRSETHFNQRPLPAGFPAAMENLQYRNGSDGKVEPQINRTHTGGINMRHRKRAIDLRYDFATLTTVPML